MISSYYKSSDRAFTLLHGDCFKLLHEFDFKFSCIFADPPYQLEDLPTLPDLIFEKQMLADGGVFILEHSKEHSFENHPCFWQHRKYGKVNFTFFKKTE